MEIISVDEVPLDCCLYYNLYLSNNIIHILVYRSEWCDAFWEIFVVSRREARLSSVKENKIFTNMNYI